MILVTGGAGYIRSAIVRTLGKQAIVLDDFRAGGRERADGVEVLEADLADAKPDWSRIEAVIHCAGSFQVGESMTYLGLYWRNAVRASPAFCRSVPRHVRVLFASTAAVYGEPAKIPIPKRHSLPPIIPYNRTQLAVETILQDLGLPLTNFRYFNAAGADEDHKPETHLISRLLDAAFGGQPLPLYGDGLHVRDFVHVDDRAKAHVFGIEHPPGIYNLGSGKGCIVREVFDTAPHVFGRGIPVAQAPTHPGDLLSLIDDASEASQALAWEAHRSLEEILVSARHFRISG